MFCLPPRTLTLFKMTLLQVLAYHNVLNVLLHQIVFGDHQHRSAKGVQVSVMQLVLTAGDGVGSLHVDISGDNNRVVVNHQIKLDFDCEVCSC